MYNRRLRSIQTKLLEKSQRSVNALSSCSKLQDSCLTIAYGRQVSVNLFPCFQAFIASYSLIEHASLMPLRAEAEGGQR